jgi:DeoR/GlpR family transcriptional regulator of sugar metabolism
METFFMGARGFSADGVFSSQNAIESKLKNAVIRASRRVVMPVDHSKHGIGAFERVRPGGRCGCSDYSGTTDDEAMAALGKRRSPPVEKAAQAGKP